VIRHGSWLKPPSLAELKAAWAKRAQAPVPEDRAPGSFPIVRLDDVECERRIALDRRECRVIRHPWGVGMRRPPSLAELKAARAGARPAVSRLLRPAQIGALIRSILPHDQAPAARRVHAEAEEVRREFIGLYTRADPRWCDRAGPDAGLICARAHPVRGPDAVMACPAAGMVALGAPVISP
jgi:hypothetical protein